MIRTLLVSTAVAALTVAMVGCEGGSPGEEPVDIKKRDVSDIPKRKPPGPGGANGGAQVTAQEGSEGTAPPDGN